MNTNDVPIPQLTPGGSAGNNAVPQPPQGIGTVTSVGLSMPTQFGVANSPVTAADTLAVSWNTQSANTVLAGPTSGGAAAPTFRSLVSGDLPGGGGSVTSVAMTVPVEMSVSGSPITTSGTLALSWATEVANNIFAGPSSGSAATPTFRTLVSADIPQALQIATLVVTGSGVTTTQCVTISGTTTGSCLLVTQSSSSSSANAISVVSGAGARGILSQTTTGAGFAGLASGASGIGVYGAGTHVNAFGVYADNTAGGYSLYVTTSSYFGGAVTIGSLSGILQAASGTVSAVTSISANTVLAGPASGGATAPTFRSLVAADIPAINLASGVTGTLAIGNGGTGQTTAANAAHALGLGTSDSPQFQAVSQPGGLWAVSGAGELTIVDIVQYSGNWTINSAGQFAATGWTITSTGNTSFNDCSANQYKVGATNGVSGTFTISGGHTLTFQVGILTGST